jgi:hypothetical protein
VDQKAKLWADQLKDLLQQVSEEWRYTVAIKCKGKEERVHIVPDYPLRSDEEWNDWISSQKDLARREEKIRGDSTEVQEEPIVYSKIDGKNKSIEVNKKKSPQ